MASSSTTWRASARSRPAKLRQLIDAAPFEADRALKEGLVDKLGYRADALDDVWQRAGTTHDLVDLQDYANDDKRPRSSGDVIALVRATGTITSGSGDGGLLDDDAQATRRGRRRRPRFGRAEART